MVTVNAKRFAAYLKEAVQFTNINTIEVAHRVYVWTEDSEAAKDRLLHIFATEGHQYYHQVMRMCGSQEFHGEIAMALTPQEVKVMIAEAAVYKQGAMDITVPDGSGDPQIGIDFYHKVMAMKREPTAYTIPPTGYMMPVKPLALIYSIIAKRYPKNLDVSCRMTAWNLGSTSHVVYVFVDEAEGFEIGCTSVLQSD